MNTGFAITNTNTGFFWGPATVTRLMDDTKHGVWIEVAGAKERLEIRVTRGGRIRVKHEKATAQNTVTPAPVVYVANKKAGGASTPTPA